MPRRHLPMQTGHRADLTRFRRPQNPGLPSSERSGAARPKIEEVHAIPNPLQARPACRPRAGRRPCMRGHRRRRRRPPPSASAPPSRSSCWAARPSRTPGRPCSTATSASPPARRSSASACPRWSTARRTPPTRVAAQAQLDLTTAYDVAAGAARARPATISRAPTSATATLKAGAYRYSSSAQLTGAAHARRRGRPQRAVRLRDRLDADDGVGQLGRARQRRQPVQRLLADRQLGDARHDDGVPGQPDGAHEHLAEQRRDGHRPRARPQRRRSA